ncbi:unnamed protein product, partial [Amoebophrya sp. A25]|eukprot:GSA25T00006118001.1
MDDPTSRFVVSRAILRTFPRDLSGFGTAISSDGLQFADPEEGIKPRSKEEAAHAKAAVEPRTMWKIEASVCRLLRTKSMPRAEMEERMGPSWWQGERMADDDPLTRERRATLADAYFEDQNSHRDQVRKRLLSNKYFPGNDAVAMVYKKKLQARARQKAEPPRPARAATGITPAAGSHEGDGSRRHHQDEDYTILNGPSQVVDHLGYFPGGLSMHLRTQFDKDVEKAASKT